MKITRITEQVKQRGRYSVFVDAAYSFSLSEATLLASRLAPGVELTAEQLAGWKRQSADDKLYGRALRYVAMRPRSVGEMRTYLQQKGASPALADQILNKLSKIDLLNDTVYAQAFVATRRLLRPTSRLKLQQQLRAKHLSDEVIGQALGSEHADEQEALRTLAAKKWQITRYRQEPQKLMRYLAGQGFGYDDIKNALDELKHANEN
ncbi:MAG TPA: RecX family transcriptional regulator [Candidatus Saccharimonadales bacterium]|nr:RecX family transcriptional regulator [Candidatus Saccharimonadales bacterium]